MAGSRIGVIAPKLYPVQTALGLRILAERGLANVDTAGQQLHVTVITREGKADLMQSVTWRRFHR